MHSEMGAVPPGYNESEFAHRPPRPAQLVGDRLWDADVQVEWHGHLGSSPESKPIQHGGPFSGALDLLGFLQLRLDLVVDLSLVIKVIGHRACASARVR